MTATRSPRLAAAPVGPGRAPAAYLSALAALAPTMGLQTGIRLHVDPGLGTLTLRLAKPLSSAEKAVGRWYGEQ